MQQPQKIRLNKSILLIAAVSVAAFTCYGFYFQVSANKPVKSVTRSPAMNRELAKAFTSEPARLSDEEYVAAAEAWEKQLHASRQKAWQPPPKTDQFVVYDAMVSEIKAGLATVGPEQPGLREALESMLVKAAEDLPVDKYIPLTQ